MELDEGLGEWECRANDVINLKLVMFEKDLGDATKTFHPTFTHQVFEGQIIRGYKNPRIDMWYVAGSLRMYLGLGHDAQRSLSSSTPTTSSRNYVSHDASGQQLPNTDVLGLLLPLIPRNNYTTNIDEFVKCLDQSFRPVGKQIHSYTLMEDEDGDDEVEYLIMKGDFTMEDVKEYHKRIEIFVLWFIDCSSFISDNDPSWEIYFIFEKRKRHGQTYYGVVGYSTVYPFYAFPDKKRLRISQVLILPPYQRKGHGAQLLNAIYADAKARQHEHSAVKDITVETPSPEFTYLRDLTDLRNCVAHGYFKSKVPRVLPQETFKAIMTDLRLCARQINHLHEVAMYISCKKNPDEYAKFRFEVKKRLYKKYQDWLQGFEEGEPRKSELQDIYEEEVESLYDRIAQKFPQFKLA